jgi:hypothetical protein
MVTPEERPICGPALAPRWSVIVAIARQVTNMATRFMNTSMVNEP